MAVAANRPNKSATLRTHTTPFRTWRCVIVTHSPFVMGWQAFRATERSNANIPTRFKCKHAIRVACEFEHTRTHTCLSGALV